MNRLIIVILALFASNSSFAVTIDQFGLICRDGDPGVASAWINSDAAAIFASLLFNPNSTVNIGSCHRASTSTQAEARSEGTPCEFVHSGEFMTVKIQFPSLIKAAIDSVSGTQILSYVNGFEPTFTSINSKGEPLQIPGRLVATCDIGSNGSYLLFESGAMWELDEFHP